MDSSTEEKMMIKHKRIITYLLSLLPIFMLLAFTAGANAATKEYRFKAAFLIQFVKYTQWPKINGDQIVVGIIGDDSFGDALDKYQDKNVQGKNLVFINIDDINEAKTCCQLLFISVSEKDRIDGIINALAGKPILTVSEIDDFTQKGGMIYLVRKGTKQKFMVSVKNADKGSLKFSPHMLKVASSVDK